MVRLFLKDNIIQVDTFPKRPPDFDMYHWVVKIEIRECSLGRPQLPTLHSGNRLPTEIEDCVCQWKHLETVRAISEARKEPIMTANEARKRLLRWALTSCHPGPCCVTRTRKYTLVSCQNCSVMFGLKLLWRCDPLWDFFFVKVEWKMFCHVPGCKL